MTVARYVCRCCSLAAMCLSGRISLYNILSKLIDVSVFCLYLFFLSFLFLSLFVFLVSCFRSFFNFFRSFNYSKSNVLLRDLFPSLFTCCSFFFSFFACFLSFCSIYFVPFFLSFGLSFCLSFLTYLFCPVIMIPKLSSYFPYVF